MNPVGFTVSTAFGLIHRHYPGLANSRPAGAQFRIDQAGAVRLVAGKANADGGGGGMPVKPGSLVVAAGAALFLWFFVTCDGD